MSSLVAQVNTENIIGLKQLVLAKKWVISPKKAPNMINCNTQHGVCTVLHLFLFRWFSTKDCQLQHQRLPHNVYTDTSLVTTVSSRSPWCTQLFAMNFGWSCSFPMKLNSEAHEAFSFHLQWEEVPPAIIWDNAKKMILGEFFRKLKEALC